jgi:hypothetical protein
MPPKTCRTYSWPNAQWADQQLDSGCSRRWARIICRELGKDRMVFHRYKTETDVLSPLNERERERERVMIDKMFPA